MYQLLSWWNSYQSLSTIGTALKFMGAIIGILILVLGLRESSLRSMAQKKEKALVAERIALAEAATKPRRLTKEQRDALTSSLNAVPQKPKIFMCAGILDAESVTFAEDIEAVLIAAGFEVYFPKELQSDASLTVGPPGLHLVIKDPKGPHPTAANLQRCFLAAGITIPGLASSDPLFPDDRIEIAVGQK